MMAHHATIESLSNDVLGRILMLLPQEDRVRSVPLVCRSWCRITADASMWPAVNVMPQLSRLDPKTDDSNNMQTWLRQRSPGMRELTLRFQGFDTVMLLSALQSVAPTATQLQQLQLMSNSSCEGHPFSGKALASVRQLHLLTRLEVSFISTPLVAGSLDSNFASLPALEFLSLHFRTAEPEGATGSDSDDEEHQPHSRNRPDDFPQSLLRCTRLTHLELCMHYPRTLNDVFTVGGLPEGISALQRLQHLQLDDCVTAPLTCGISRLTQLTHLAVLQTGLGIADICEPSEVVALPASLPSLEVVQVPVEVLAQLTALEIVDLEETVSNAAETTCSLSNLQRLTLLIINDVGEAELAAFAGCSNLRRLCLRTLELDGEPLPLPFPQLTRLRLSGGDYLTSDVMTMVSELPQLEVLDVIDTEEAFELDIDDAAALARLPKLHIVNLTGSLLWEPAQYSQVPQGMPPREYVPVDVLEYMMRLQQAGPHIKWVLKDVS